MKTIIFILSIFTLIACRSNYAYDGSVLGKEKGVKCTAKFISNEYLKAQDSSFKGDYNLARVRFFHLRKSKNQIHKYCFYVKVGSKCRERHHPTDRHEHKREKSKPF